MPGDVTSVGLALSVSLVALAALLSWWRRLGLETSILWAAIRAAGQLLAAGGLLLLVIDPDRSIALSWAWVLMIVVVAADTVRRRAREAPGVVIVALAAFGAAGAATLGIIFGLGIFPVEGRTVVPLAGMMVGNSMTATVLVARRIVRRFADERDDIEARLALGLSATDATLSHVREAVRDALTPQIERTKTVGIVFLPGAMTGLILAGVDPVDAVLVQIVVMYLVLASVAVTTGVVAWGVARRLVTDDDRLVPIARQA